jgi:hypothetical protein
MKELKGKQLSLRAKIVAAAVAIASLGIKIAGLAPDLDIMDVLKVTTFIVVIFSPVDISLWLEKIPGVKNGNG